MKRILFIALISLCIHVRGQVNTPNFSREVVIIDYKEENLMDSIAKNWQHKDILIDNIPGISSNLAYKYLEGKSQDTIIVAIIDSGVDINHPDLNGKIWKNSKEVPDNGRDDDKNGYIDDVHGWNFLGNKRGVNQYFANHEYVRILYKASVLSKERIINKKNLKDSTLLRAAQFYENAQKELNDEINYVSEKEQEFQIIHKNLKSYFPNRDYSIEKLNQIDTLKNSNLAFAVRKAKEFVNYKMTYDWFLDYKKYVDILSNYNLNPTYDDNKLIKREKIRFYGNNDVKGDTGIDTHGTVVATVLAANRHNNIGIDGVADKVKLMILRTVPDGDEYDQDVALAIRYAVDNGAKIINASFGKFFSPENKLVMEAIKYASKHNVLIVHAAGNDSENIDNSNFYPTDIENNREIVANFISVGAIHYKLNHKLPAYFSNYGKENVDLFAPGYYIYASQPNNTYNFQNGTSIAAPIVSGIAATILSLNPDLSVEKLKEIILNSGDNYNLQITVPGRYGEEKISFKDLSKTGKVVNMFNAIRTAESIYK